MPKITKEQIQKTNAKCSNDWRLDVEYYLFHNEKRLIKHIELDDKHYLEFALQYNTKNQISLHISKFEHEQGDYFAHSEGLGKNTILIEKTFTRKIINNLIDFTNVFNDDECMRINAITKVTKSPLFVASEEF